MVLYDLTLRNLTIKQLLKAQQVLLDKNIFNSDVDRREILEVNRDAKPLMKLTMFHLTPELLMKAQEIIFRENLYPVMLEIKR